MKKRITTAQARLLEVLWLKNGTIAGTAEVLGCVSAERLANWRRREGVPLQFLGEISRALKVPQFALNYEEMVDLLGSGPTWERVLQECRLTGAEANYISKGTPPATVKEILVG